MLIELPLAQSKAEIALRMNGNLAEAHELPVGLYALRRQPAGAAREYNAALALHPGSAQTELRLGTVLGAQGKREAARAGDNAIARAAQEALRELGIR